MSEKLKLWAGSKGWSAVALVSVLFIKLQFPQARRVHPLADLYPVSREAKER